MLTGDDNTGIGSWRTPERRVTCRTEYGSPSSLDVVTTSATVRRRAPIEEDGADIASQGLAQVLLESESYEELRAAMGLICGSRSRELESIRRALMACGGTFSTPRAASESAARM